MNSIASIHPGQWEVINGEAWPKNNIDFVGCNEIDVELQDAYADYEQFANQHIYSAPGILSKTYESSELVFKWQYRSEDTKNEWVNEDRYESELYGNDYDRFASDCISVDEEPRQIIALAEPQVTPPVDSESTWTQQDLTFKVAAELENVFDIKHTGAHESTHAYEIESVLSSIIERMGMKLIIEDEEKFNLTLGQPFDI